MPRKVHFARVIPHLEARPRTAGQVRSNTPEQLFTELLFLYSVSFVVVIVVSRRWSVLCAQAEARAQCPGWLLRHQCTATEPVRLVWPQPKPS